MISMKLTERQKVEGVTEASLIVQLTVAVAIASLRPHQTRGVNKTAEHDGTRDQSKQADHHQGQSLSEGLVLVGHGSVVDQDVAHSTG